MKAFVAAVLAVAALPLFAQQFDDSITVNVVEIPVYVERFGQPVTGLTRDDFELFVDGKRQSIEYFDVIAHGDAQPVSSEPAAVQTEDLSRRRMFVLLFDTGGSSAFAIERARRSALQHIASSDSADTFAVATIGRKGVQFLVPFTTDRVAIQRAIGTLAPSEAADPFLVATSDVERTAWRESTSGSERLDMASDVDGAIGFARTFAPFDLYLAALRGKQDEQYLGDLKFIDNIGDLGERLAPFSGVKHVVLLSERHGIVDVARIDYLTRMHERFRNASVVLDAVDIRLPFVPGGGAGTRTSAAEAESLLPLGFLVSLAADTGGTVSTSFDQVRRSNSLTYVLSFHPADAKKKHSVRVRVKDQPLLTEVRYRRTFTADEPNAGGDPLFLADTLLNDIPQRGVTLDLDVVGNSIAAKIPGAELLAGTDNEKLPLEVFLYVFDENGKPVQWREARIDVDVEAGREFLETNAYTIRQAFRLQPGRYAAKAIVRIPGTGKAGFQRTDFIVQ